MTSEEGVDMTRRRLLDGGTGCIGVVVDAKSDAVAFYSSLGFEPMDLSSGALGDRPEPVAMFLPIGQIAVAVEQATN